MIKSMTGYGSAILANDKFEIKIEIKSVNSKFCDINMKNPRLISMFEIPLKAMISDKLVRGKVDIGVDVYFTEPVVTPVLNKAQLVQCVSLLNEMKDKAGIDEEISYEHILKFSDVIEYRTVLNAEEIELSLKSAVSEAVDKLDKMRAAEGKNLEQNINKHLESISGLVEVVDKSKDGIYDYWLNRFKTRLSEFGAEAPADRIVQEAAIYAEKADIQEEIARIQSHLKQFNIIMAKEFPCGKKLDFLCQELYREWNTIASKSINAEIINSVVDAKSAVDSIREQVQNVI